MKKFLALLVVSASLLCSSALAVSEQCQRIISLSPTITDTLISLGLEKNIVAGTRYDRLPKDSHIQSIGGMLDPNYEAIIKYGPSIIFTDLDADSPQARRLHELKLSTYNLSSNSLADIQSSVKSIGKICNIEATAQAKLDELNHTLQSVQLDHYPHTALIFYTYHGDDHITRLPQHAAGQNFHQDLLSAIGIQYAYKGNLNAPTLSQEGLLMLNPDILIFLEGDQNYFLGESRTISIEKEMPTWPNLQNLKAIRNQQVYKVKGEPTFIASPDAVIATLLSLHQLFNQSNQ